MSLRSTPNVRSVSPRDERQRGFSASVAEMLLCPVSTGVEVVESFGRTELGAIAIHCLRRHETHWPGSNGQRRNRPLRVPRFSLFEPLKHFNLLFNSRGLRFRSSVLFCLINYWFRIRTRVPIILRVPTVKRQRGSPTSTMTVIEEPVCFLLLVLECRHRQSASVPLARRERGSLNVVRARLRF